DESYTTRGDASRVHRRGHSSRARAAACLYTPGDRRAPRGYRVQPAPARRDRVSPDADGRRSVPGGTDDEFRDAPGHLRPAFRECPLVPVSEAVQARIGYGVLPSSPGAIGDLRCRFGGPPVARAPRQVRRRATVRWHRATRPASWSTLLAG